MNPHDFTTPPYDCRSRRALFSIVTWQGPESGGPTLHATVQHGSNTESTWIDGEITAVAAPGETRLIASTPRERVRLRFDMSAAGPCDRVRILVPPPVWLTD